MSPSRAWWLVAASLIAAFLARAPLYLSVFPPFEGWDEPQHLAYIVTVHVVTSVFLIFSSASRNRLFAVPSGMFSRSAISAMVRPLKA